MIEQIIQSLICEFDFAYIISINILTYIFIKTIDYFNGDKNVTFWQKRLLLILSIIVMFIIYYNIDDYSMERLINSSIAAPVAWSWLIKPILSKTKFDYKSIDKTIN